MKIQLINKVSTVVFLSIATIFTSCQDDDSLARRGKPTVSIDVNSKTVTEGETATFDLTVEYAISEPIDIRIDVLDAQGNPIPVTEPVGDPNSGNGYSPLDLEDISVPYDTWFESGYFSYGYLGGSGYITTIPAYSNTFQVNIDAKLDYFPEGTETVNFRVTATDRMEGKIDEVITVNIDDYVSDELVATLSWDGDYIADPCADLDFDLELLDGAFTYIDFSYANCPEEITILGTAPDDTYTLDVSLWEAFVTGDLDIPVFLTFAKPGVFVETVDLSSLYPLADGGAVNGNPNAYNSFTIVKTGTTYTITDASATVIASGRTAEYRMSIEEKKALKQK